MTSIATGRLVFCPAESKAEKRPIHNMKVKLWDADTVSDDFLAEGVTDINGRFNLRYDPKQAGFLDTPDLKLMVYDLQPLYDNKGNLETKEVEVPSYHPTVHNNVTKTNFDFGDVEVKYWEYQPMGESYTPRLYINSDEGYPLMQEQRPGWKKEDFRAKVATGLKSFSFPPTKMQLKEKEMEGGAFGDDAIVEMMLNGFNPCIPQKADDGRLYVEFKYDGIQQDGKHHAPNSRAYFKLDKKEDKLTLDTIELTERIGGYQRGHTAIYGNPTVYSASTCKPGDWEKVKRIWRVNYFLFGEVTTHLGGTHLNVEQYIVPMMRNVRLNPVFNLLFPHFYGTVAINYGADQLLTGGSALVPLGSAVTNDSVATVARKGFEAMNWADWEPRAKICKSHTFAELQQEFWDVLDIHIGKYIEENEEGIVKHWYEILMWSDELVANGVPYVQQEDNYYCMGEMNKATSEHPSVSKWNVAVSPITKVKELTKENKAENLAQLKQLCKYLMLLTTFKHSWVNDSQYDIGGWPEFATLGLDHDILDPENVNKDPVSTKIQKLQKLTTFYLKSTEWGYIIKNEARDMHPRLVQLLKERGEKFHDIGGYKINKVRSCINI